MTTVSEEQLEQMALEEVLAETERSKRRAEIAGATGWRPQARLNRTFLQNTLRIVRNDHERKNSRFVEESSHFDLR